MTSKRSGGMGKTLERGPRKGPRLTRRAVAISFLSVFGASALFAFPASRASGPRIRGGAKWAVFYGEDVDPAQLASFELMVLDPNFVRPILSLKSAGAMVLGYLSLGEVNRAKPEFESLSRAGALLQQNPTWPDSFALDVRNPAWRKLLLDVVIPRMVAQGFDGLFLDTLDSPPHLEASDPQRFHGMTAAAVSLVRAIRRRYPDRPLMMNRGYALLPKLIKTIDAVVAESMLTSFHANDGTYHAVDEATVARHLDLLRPAYEARRPLPVYSLDYWQPGEIDAVRDIYARERSLGHSPYVATVLLDQIVAEPLEGEPAHGINHG